MIVSGLLLFTCLVEPPAAAPAPEAVPVVSNEQAWAEAEAEANDANANADAGANANADANASESADAIATATATASADAAPAEVYVPFDIGLVPGLSINGRHRGKPIRNKFSLSFGWSRTTRLDGIALALAATIVDEDAQGITASLGANVTRGIHRGAQFTNGYNYAFDLRGVQSGGLNRAEHVRGVQIGLVNIGGHVRGAQIGLVNWAKSADASFALLPITREGGIRFEVSTSDTALVNIGVRLPARHTYAFLGAGLHPFGTKRGHVGTELERGKAWEFGGGFGVHVPVTKTVFIDLDLSGWGVTSGLRQGAALGGLGKARVMAGWQAAPHLAIFGGPTLNVLVDAIDPDPIPLGNEAEGVRIGKVERPGYGWVAYAHSFDDVRVRVWPGFVAGMRF
jgi:hypothetical protein